ncbi:DUF6572 domain-containing protein [Flavobacterium sp.]|uniref:DUF6572 domain-containing protein n=1 Tax=Flavobacterium sp. TaxID=239 RepID=UPI00260FAB72|nr:DUF6572 domain-containing protein [Flavobacterium sp.]
MAVDNPSIIDFISITPNNEVCLTISDHLKWNETEHYFHLENKINSYVEIIDNNQIYEIYPDAIGKFVLINIALKYKPTKKAIKFLEKLNDILKSKKYGFSYSIIN